MSSLWVPFQVELAIRFDCATGGLRIISHIQIQLYHWVLQFHTRPAQYSQPNLLQGRPLSLRRAGPLQALHTVGVVWFRKALAAFKHSSAILPHINPQGRSTGLLPKLCYMLPRNMTLSGALLWHPRNEWLPAGEASCSRGGYWLSWQEISL